MLNDGNLKLNKKENIKYEKRGSWFFKHEEMSLNLFYPHKGEAWLSMSVTRVLGSRYWWSPRVHWLCSLDELTAFWFSKQLVEEKRWWRVMMENTWPPALASMCTGMGQWDGIRAGWKQSSVFSLSLRPGDVSLCSFWGQEWGMAQRYPCLCFVPCRNTVIPHRERPRCNPVSLCFIPDSGVEQRLPVVG